MGRIMQGGFLYETRQRQRYAGGWTGRMKARRVWINDRKTGHVQGNTR